MKGIVIYGSDKVDLMKACKVLWDYRKVGIKEVYLVGYNKSIIEACKLYNYHKIKYIKNKKKNKADVNHFVFDAIDNAARLHINFLGFEYIKEMYKAEEKIIIINK